MQAMGDWEACGEHFFSRELLYDMEWQDMELSSKRIACARFGGPIATVRDERQMVALGAGGMRPVIRTFTASGKALGSAMWAGAGILEWGWSDELELVVVDTSGMLWVFNMHCERLREVVLLPKEAGRGAEGAGAPSACVIHGSGAVALLTQGWELWVVSGLSTELHRTRMAMPPVALTKAPAAMAVVGAKPEAGSDLEVFMAVGAVVWQLDETNATEHRVLTPTTPAAAPAAVSGSSSGGGGTRSAGGNGGAATGSRGSQPAAAAAAATARLPDISHLAVSPDSQFLAVFTSDGRLLVLSSDLSKHISEFETKTSAPPSSITWCGVDAVGLMWPEVLLLVGPQGDYLSISLLSEEAMAGVAEVDGLRLLSNSRHEMMRRVPQCSEQVFRPGSTFPAAQLWEARELWEANSARCDKVLRLLKEELPCAVITTIQAAGLDTSVARQRALLRAACYGRAFCPSDFPPLLLHSTCSKLRLLNALREPAVGMPLTMGQLEALTVPVVVARLIAYRQWLLAFRIAGTLQPAAATMSMKLLPGAGAATASSTSLLQPASGLPMGAAASSLGAAGMGPGGAFDLAVSAQDQVLLQWACAKISSPASQALPDQQLKDAITAKLKAAPNIRFAPLAAHAQAVGRRLLALKLLEEESSCGLQVPLLLSLSIGARGDRLVTAGRKEDAAPFGGGVGEGEEDTLERALRKAIESGDTDLVYLVLFHIYRHRPLPEFWILVSSRALARNLFVKYCKAKEPELLETILGTSATLPSAAAELADLQLHLALHRWAASTGAASPGSASTPGSGSGFSTSSTAAPPTAAAVAGGSSPAAAAAAGARGGISSMSQAGVDAALTRLVASLADISHKYALSREHTFQSRAASELALLRKEQAKLEKDVGQRLFLGLSLIDTLRTCIRLGHHKAAAALKKQFNVTDRRFAWLKVRVLAEGHDWDGLELFAGERRTSPIGWEPFLEAAKKFHAPREYQARMIARLPDSAAKAGEYTAIDCTREAAEVAAKLRDADLFTSIQNAVSANSPAGLAIAQIRERAMATFR
ncbi:MAG: hypothetical protein WDW36_001730 [Sanguina aurantia]